jgi:glutamate-1-semialdehyde 2,1-aminomutase
MVRQKEALRSLSAEIREKSPRSYEAWQRYRDVLPAGVGSRFRLARPFPMVVRDAKGSRVWDVDDNEYVDCSAAFGPLILGNTPEIVARAVAEQLPKGWCYGASHENEYALAKLVVESMPSIKKVAFCNSGSEATLYALRLARAATGRSMVAKFEGGYHGVHDFLVASTISPRIHPDMCGPIEDPLTVPESPGLLQAAWQETITLPFNHPAALEKIERYADQLAAVIVEPVQGGGAIAAKKDFLEQVRLITAKTGILLVLDEVLTGYRVALGGGQQLFDVVPDITTLGKVLGGGFPMGAVGGSAKVMRYMEYDQDPGGTILFGGTFNGNPISMAAGCATLSWLLAHPEAYQALGAKGDRIRDELNEFCQEHNFRAQVIGLGSIFAMHLVDGEINGPRDLSREDRGAAQALGMLLRLKGLHILPHHGFLSTAHSESDIDFIIDVYKEALRDLRSARLVD